MLHMSTTKRAIALSVLAAAARADYSIPISYESTLEAYYYFRTGAGDLTIGADGLTISVTSGDVCDVLASAQVVYSADSGEDVLLSANCYDVYYLDTTAGDAITWTTCVEFPFYASVCGDSATTAASTSSDAETTTESATGIVSSTSSSLSSTSVDSDDETYILTVVTSYEENIAYSYTTYCPLTEAAAPSSFCVGEPAYSVVDATFKDVVTTGVGGSATTTQALVTVTDTVAPSTTVVTITSCDENKCSIIPITTGLTVVTTTEAGVVTEYTTFCPLSSETATSATASATEATETTAAEGLTTVSPQEASSTSSESGSSETWAAVSTFSGAGAKVVSSLSVGVVFAIFGLFI